jgi:hypothetical protein
MKSGRHPYRQFLKKKSIKIRKIRSKCTRDNIGTVRKSGIPINRPVSPINWPV